MTATTAPGRERALEELLELVREDLVAHPGPVDAARVSRVLREHGRLSGPAEVLAATVLVRDHVEGLGPLQALLAPDVTDILVNDDGQVWVEDADGLRRAGMSLDRVSARALAVRLATAGGRRLDDAMPWADAQLPSGIRLHAVLPPLSAGGAAISLRIPAPLRLGLGDLEQRGAFPAPLVEVLRGIVRARVPFLVTGGTGTGKTTLLAAMLAQASPEERIIVVEDALELSIEHPHVLRLQARHSNSEGAGAIDLATLVRQSLRMRPDRVVLGECRGGEIRDLLQALNTGHEGGCGTVHANAVADVPARLEALGALAGLDRHALAAQAASALDLVLHLERRGSARRLREIGVIDRGPGGELRCTTALDVEGDRIRRGPAAGDLERLLQIEPHPSRGRRAL